MVSLSAVPFLAVLPLLLCRVNSQEITGSCKTIVRVRGDEGNITSPSYPFISKGQREKCAWRLEVAQGSRIHLQFEDFDLQSPGACGGSKCECSYMIIRNAGKILKYCNENKPPNEGIFSNGNRLRLQVLKVPGVESRGVKFRYSTIAPTTAPPTTMPVLPPTTESPTTVLVPPRPMTTPLVNIYTRDAQNILYAPVVSTKSPNKEKDKYKYVVLAPAIPAVLLFVGGVIGIAIYQHRKEEEGDEELERLTPRRRSRVARIKEFFHRKDDEKDSGRDALYDEMLKNWRTNQQDNKQSIWDDYVKARRRSKIRKEIQQYTDQSFLSPEETKRAKRVSWHDAVTLYPTDSPPVELGPKPKPVPTDNDTNEVPSILVREASDDEEEGLIRPEQSPVEEAEIIPTLHHQAETEPCDDVFEEIPMEELPPRQPTPPPSEPVPSTTVGSLPDDILESIDWDAPVQETSLLTEAPYSCSDHLKGIMGDSYDKVSPEDERDWSPTRKDTPEDQWNPWEYRAPSRRKRQTSTDTSDVDD